MRRSLVISPILFGLVGIFFCASDAFAVDLIVRQKKQNQYRAFQFGQTADDRKQTIEVKSFSSEAEKNAYVETLDPTQVEWEEKVEFSGDDVSIVNTPTSGNAEPLFGDQWAILSKSTDAQRIAGPDIAAVQAWTITRGSDKVVVYVMDSGIDPNAPDLKEHITSAYDAFKPGEFPTDENGHGTHVASIATANGDNKIDMSGVVPGPVQLAVGRFLNASNQGDTNTALSVVEWEKEDFISRKNADPEIRAVSINSWSGAYSAMLERSLNEFAELGAAIIVSAGNTGKNNDETGSYPCNFKVKAIICVAASDQNDVLADFSAYGPHSVHILAPGKHILGLTPGHFSGSTYTSDHQYKDGTSQAVPHVGGGAALIFAANLKLTNKDVHDILLSSVDRIPGAEKQVVSAGRLNVYRAVLVATGRDPSLADRGFGATEASGGGCSLSANGSFDFSLIVSFIILSGMLFLMRRKNLAKLLD